MFCDFKDSLSEIVLCILNYYLKKTKQQNVKSTIRRISKKKLIDDNEIRTTAESFNFDFI